MISVGDHVTWAYCDEDVSEDEVGVVEVIYEGGIEADVAFEKGAFCLELSDLTKVHDEPPNRSSGYDSPGKGVISAPRRPSRAYEEEEDDDCGDDDVSSASSRRLNFDAHDGADDGTDYYHDVSNDDGAWDTDEGADVRASREPHGRVVDRRSAAAVEGINLRKGTQDNNIGNTRTSTPLIEGDFGEESGDVEEFDEASVGTNSIDRYRPPVQNGRGGRGGVSKGRGGMSRSNIRSSSNAARHSPASTSSSSSRSPRRVTRPPVSVPKGGNNSLRSTSVYSSSSTSTLPLMNRPRTKVDARV